MPSGLWNPEVIPSAESSASRRPVTIVIGTPHDLLGPADERAAVAGVAAGGGRDRPQLADPHGLAQRAEAHQRGQRLVDGILGEQPGGQHLAAEAGENLFVEDRRQAAGQPLVDDEADRVRPDVDDADRRSVVDAALGDDLAAAAAGHLIQGRDAASGCGARTP